MYVLTSGANVPDISRAIDLLDGYPPIAGRRGRPHRRFDVPLADTGYDSEAFRQACRERGMQPIIPRRKTSRIKGLGKLRYVLEQTIALLHQFRRLAIRWERRLDIHDGLVSLACALICCRRLIQSGQQRSCQHL
ncbi:transposase [Actinoplanes sp. NPDC051343]|uniref:transposase n=1 Tax=Actinoplanes sp. NPDC051343 TaxID=3363906 RepID=UPI0037B57F37